MNKSQTKECRRERSWRWRQDHGIRTVRGLVRQCRHCGKDFSPKNVRALSCTPKCSLAFDKENRIRPNPEEKFAERLKWNHGLSVEDRQQLLDEQKGLCKLCKLPFDENVRELRACMDHDHKCCRIGASCQKCRRGFIHQRCNLILGHAKDSRELLQQADKYLEKYAL